MSAEYWQSVLSDPLVKERLRRVGDSITRGEGVPRVVTPGEVIGQRAITAASISPYFDNKWGSPSEWRVLQETYEPDDRERLARAIMDSVPFWWPNAIDQEIRAVPLPRHIIGKHLLPLPSMYVEFEGEHNGIDSLLLRSTTGGIELVYIGGNPGDMPVRAERIPHGARYPDDFPPGAFAESVLKFLAFAASPYTETIQRKPSRPERKALTRAGFQYEPEVHVVQLRARVPSNRDIPPNQQPGTAHWQHRWWVRGHFRAQWYAKEQAHKVIWIAPYVKGPDDAPIKSAVYAVVR